MEPIKILSVSSLPEATSQAEKLLSSESDVVRAAPMLPWVESVTEYLRKRIILVGTRRDGSSRVDYTVSDIFLDGSNHVVDLTLYDRGERSLKGEVLKVEGSREGLLELVNGRVRVIVEDESVELFEGEGLFVLGDTFEFILDSANAKLRVSVDF